MDPTSHKKLLRAAAGTEKRDLDLFQSLLDATRDEPIAESLLEVVARNFWNGAKAMRLLLDRHTNLALSESTVAAAAGNERDGIEVIKLLLSRYAEIPVTPQVVEVALQNRPIGGEVMKLLLSQRKNIPITTGMVVAAASNQEKGREVMELLLLRGKNILITTEVVVAAAGNTGQGREVMEFLCGCDKVTITEGIVAETARYFDEGIMELLLLRDENIPITIEVVVAAAANTKRGREVMKLLYRSDKVTITEGMVAETARRFDEGIMELLLSRGENIPITTEVVVAAAGNIGQGREVMKLLYRSDKVTITEGMVTETARHFDEDIMELLLLRDENIPITTEVLVAAAGNIGEGSEVVGLLLSRGKNVLITTEVLVAAAGNIGEGSEVVGLLLSRGKNVLITTEVLVAAARNIDEGSKVIELLLLRGKNVLITTEVLVAAAGNIGQGSEVMELLLSRGKNVLITTEVLVAAAGNIGQGSKVMELLLSRGKNVLITTEVLVAAAGNTGQGRVVMLLLLSRGKNVPITTEVLVAAVGNTGQGREVMELLLSRGEDVPITTGVVVATAGNWRQKREIIELLLSRGNVLLQFSDVPPLAVEDKSHRRLLERIKRSVLLTGSKGTVIDTIRNKIFMGLNFNGNHTEKSIPDKYTANFEVAWNPVAFLKEQYPDEGGETLGAIITLTGLATDAQALPCAQYMQQTWPLTGNDTLQALKLAISKGTGHICKLWDGTELEISLHPSTIFIRAIGTEHALAEVGEQFGWLGATCRASPYNNQMSYCTARITMVTNPNPLFELDFYSEEITSDERQRLDGSCWHSLFKNPVIAKGYPIARKPELGTGLEIPLDIMAGLAQTQLVEIFHGKLFIKGFSTMLVPIKHCGDLLVWHLLCNKDGSRISYLDDTVDRAENISMSDLETSRHVVGWCWNVGVYAGAADSNYTIERSRLPAPHAGCAFEKVSISGGKFITGGAAFAIGVKDKPFHVSRKGFVPQLQWISKKFVVLWDEGDKRGWLVNGTSALLHLLRASLKYNEKDKFQPVFLFKSDAIQEAATPHTSDSAIKVLLNPLNMKLKIYPEKDEMYDEETKHKDAIVEEVSKKKKTFYRLEDRVEQLYNVLEKIIDHQVEAAGQNGVKLKWRVRKHLEGWDFVDLATDRDPVYPRVATLETLGKGWVDLARSIQAITLFGHGFGDIIQPTTDTAMCSHWENVPKGKYYLAACVSDIREIMELNGDPNANPMKLSETIIWHNPGKIFERCQCRVKIQGEHSDFVQVLLPPSFSWLSAKARRIQLGESGAVIFGHNTKFKYYFKDAGDPVEGEASLSSAEPEIDPQGSGIGSSTDSSAPIKPWKSIRLRLPSIIR